MPKSPILERDLLYEVLPDKSLRLLDWCVVNVEGFGTMVEPRQVNMVNGTNAVTNVEVYDTTYTRIRQLQGDLVFSEYGLNGRQIPVEFVLP